MKPARQYAAEIAALTSLEARRKALKRVPANLRPIAEKLLLLRWERLKHEEGMK